MRRWSELFPEGRVIFYEGNDPVGFAIMMRERFQIDVHNTEGWDEENGWCFLCPSNALDEVYGTGNYSMGS